MIISICFAHGLSWENASFNCLTDMDTLVRGFRISWAMPAAIRPVKASLSERTDASFELLCRLLCRCEREFPFSASTFYRENQTTKPRSDGFSLPATCRGGSSRNPGILLSDSASHKVQACHTEGRFRFWPFRIHPEPFCLNFLQLFPIAFLSCATLPGFKPRRHWFLPQEQVQFF